MDAATAAALIMGLQTVGTPAAEMAKDLIGRFLGPTVDIGGDALKNWVHTRIARGHDTVITAAAILEQSGLEPRPVPGRILLPILEHSSLEEDDALRTKWAALLANAATPEHGDYILPAYAEILRQLTPVHVGILDWIFENAQEPSAEEPTISTWRDVEADEVSYRFGLNGADYQIVASDLHRLQVAQASWRAAGLTRPGVAVVRPPSSSSSYPSVMWPPSVMRSPASRSACRTTSARSVTPIF